MNTEAHGFRGTLLAAKRHVLIGKPTGKAWEANLRKPRVEPLIDADLR